MKEGTGLSSVLPQSCGQAPLWESEGVFVNFKD